MAHPDPEPPSPEMLAALRGRLPPGGDCLPLEDFIDCVLYHPQAGYYTRARARVGRRPERDFYTAASLGGVFTRLVTAAARDLLGDDPGRYTFVEFGPETARGIMGDADHSPFREVMLVRPGDAFTIPEQAIVFSNELFDAQPFRRLIRTAAGWKELGVALRGGRLEWRVMEPAQPLPDLPDDLPEGYLVDWPGRAHALLQAICRQQWRGVFMACDYGLDRATVLRERPQGTGRTYAAHQMGDDLLARPGECDITCHVIWDPLEEILAAHGFEAIRLQRQEAFFMTRGQDAIREIIESAPPGFSPARQTLKELLHPANMGHKFQVLSARRGLV